MDAPATDCVLQRAGDVLLADDVGERLRPVFARQNQIRHGQGLKHPAAASASDKAWPIVRYGSKPMELAADFRNLRRAEQQLTALSDKLVPGRTYRIMEFCGGHTHALCQSGLLDRLPAAIQMIHGPGCPVCVLPTGRIQQAIDLVLREPVILCSYGDMLRVPALGHKSLLSARAQGADVRVVYSTEDALAVARQNPTRQVVLFAVGFETTTPMTAAAMLTAKQEPIRNFSVLVNHVLTPPALTALLQTAQDQVRIDGFIGPGHVATVTGSDAFLPFAQRYRKPIAIAGFEPTDLLLALHAVIDNINAGTAHVENTFSRAVTQAGNLRAKQIIEQVLEVRESFAWRGLGDIAHSALRARQQVADFDAEKRFSLSTPQVPDHKHCRCPDVLRGICAPTECTLFAAACTPDTPIGSCMVSSEGACAAYFQIGRTRRREVSTARAHATSRPGCSDV